MKTHLIFIQIGDYYDDGHGKYATELYQSNKDVQEIKEAYKKGSLIIGTNMIKSFCKKYEDDGIPISFISDIFKKAGKLLDFDNFYFSEYIGFEEIDFSSEETQQGMFYLVPEDWAGLYRVICLLGDPELTLKKVKTKQVDVGGYGMFYG